MAKINTGQIDIESFFHMLDSSQADISDSANALVEIEKVINIKTLKDFKVSCSYGDIVLIINMLRDYVRLLDEVRGDDLTYQAYYRDKFMKIADRLSEQINYSYDKALEKCLNKQTKDRNDDVGGDALELAVNGRH